VAAGFGDLSVPEILESSPVLFKVDENRDLAALAISDELTPVMVSFCRTRGPDVL
jgi:hypothetical protein